MWLGTLQSNEDPKVRKLGFPFSADGGVTVRISLALGSFSCLQTQSGSCIMAVWLSGLKAVSLSLQQESGRSRDFPQQSTWILSVSFCFCFSHPDSGCHLLLPRNHKQQLFKLPSGFLLPAPAKPARTALSLFVLGHLSSNPGSAHLPVLSALGLN